MESEDNAERRFDAPLHAGGKDTLLVCMPVTGNVTLTVAILSSARWREIVDHIQYVGLIITACLVSPHGLQQAYTQRHCMPDEARDVALIYQVKCWCVRSSKGTFLLSINSACLITSITVSWEYFIPLLMQHQAHMHTCTHALPGRVFARRG